MNIQESVDQAKSKLNALLEERKALIELINNAKIRLSALEGKWTVIGEIKKAQIVVRDAHFPVYGGGPVGRPIRIVSVEGNWIGLRTDMSDCITFYSKKTGVKKGSRDKSYSIDVEKALSIWEEYKEGNPPVLSSAA